MSIDEKLLEEWKQLKEPKTVEVTKTNKKGKRIKKKVTIHPYETLKKEVEQFLENKNASVVLVKDINSDPALAYKLVSAAEYLSGKGTHTIAVDALGFETRKWRDKEDLKRQLQKIITEKLILDAYKGTIPRPAFPTNILKRTNKGRKILTRYNHKKGTVLKDTINEAYSYLTEQIGGLTPYDVLATRNKSPEQIKEEINEKFYNREDIGPIPLKRYDWHLVETIGKKTSPKDNVQAKHSRSKDLSKKICTYLYYPDAKPSDIVGSDKKSGTTGKVNSIIGNLLEKEVNLFFNILKYVDPNLNNFPELKKIISEPLEDVAMLSHKTELQVRSLEPIIYADAKLRTNGETVLIEVKSDKYYGEKRVHDWLVHYQDKTKWKKDLENIGKKILLVQSKTNNYEKISEIAKEYGFLTITQPKYSEWYKKAIDLLQEKNPDFEKTSPLNTKESLLKAHQMLSEETHILQTAPWMQTATRISEILSKNIKYLRGNQKIFHINTNKYPQKYTVHLKSLIGERSDLYKFLPEEPIWPGTIVIDVESSGFKGEGGTSVNLGIGDYNNGDPIATIFLITNPLLQEENALKEYKKMIEKAGMILTYNGERFDVPILNYRYFANRIRYLIPERREDLLNMMKTALKLSNKTYPQKALQNFEIKYLDLKRKGDIPGSMIPEEYKKHLLGEKHINLEKIALHNAYDLFTPMYMPQFLMPMLKQETLKI